MPNPSAHETPEKIAARSAGLKYVSDSSPGIRRQQSGKDFRYRHCDGKLVRDRGTLQRIRVLAIPPAWTDLWICPVPNGHIQAVGRDAKGRKQYKYHPQWCEMRDANKYEHVVGFARLLPALRIRVARDMARPALVREKVLATIVSLLDKSLIRVGNNGYARENDSYGLTTLRSHHVRLGGHEIKFHFKGKGGKTWRLSVRDRRIARVVRSIQDLPGQDLFQYIDDTGAIRTVSSSDVNDYLREVTGKDVTAKDFRTWAGSVMAAMALDALGPPANPTQAKSNVRRAVEAVAARLGNTPAVCRKSYVHPRIVDAYMQGSGPILRLREAKAANRRALPEEENALLRLLSRRSARKPSGPRQRIGFNGATACSA
jgi:DNA topoisomerase-1